MSDNKYTENSHCIIRAKERLGIKSITKATNLIERALKKGTISNLNESEIEFIHRKVNKDIGSNWYSTDTIAIYYQKCIFIFNTISKRCITLFPAPNWFSDVKRENNKMNNYDGKNKIKNNYRKHYIENVRKNEINNYILGDI